MGDVPSKSEAVPRIESLRVKNYRALKDLVLNNLTPMSALLGPNGSGKSTVFDVFAFLSECFTEGLRRAWDKRGRFRELRTRGAEGPIEFELKYRERPDATLVTYVLSLEETTGGPVVKAESLKWRRGRSYGQPFKFLDFAYGTGNVVSGEVPDEDDQRVAESLESPELLAVSTLGQLARNPRVAALRRFITGWYLSYLSGDSGRGRAEAGPQERLEVHGENLPNVVQYLHEKHPQRLEQILRTLTERVPRLERVTTEMMPDGYLLLQIKDAPFDRPILARWASDGTLMLLAYLTVLYDPTPPALVGIEEPENHLHPRLLPGLAEECQKAAGRTQLLVTTHSPFFVNSLSPEEVWVLYRDRNGYTQARRVADMPGIPQMVESGAQLGDLWLEGFFSVGDPLRDQGEPAQGTTGGTGR
jgi:predicted ATPase